MTEIYNWVDDPTVSGVAKCDTDVLNDCLMHLKYNHKPSGSTRNIGDIFYTLRLDETLNGAYLCDGTEFVKEDFTGEQNPYDLLVLGRIPSLSYEEYEQELVNNFGNCGYFALDIVNKKFKVPTLHQISMEATKAGEEVGIFIQDQLQEHTHKYIAPDTNNMPRGDDRTNCVTYTLNPKTSGVQDARVGDRTKSRTISVRFMVQLCTDCTDISIGQYSARIEDNTQSGLTLIDNKTIESLDALHSKANDGLEILNNACTSLTLCDTTNCVLEAPNGIAECVDNAIVIKSNLKLLIADGRTSDGKLKNLQYVIPEDIVYDPTGLAQGERTLIISAKGKMISIITQNLFYGDVFPTVANAQIFFNEVENKWYHRDSSASEWIADNFIVLGNFNYTDGNITALKTKSVKQVLMNSNLDYINTLPFPSSKFLNISPKSSGSSYIAPANGYFHIFAKSWTNFGWVDLRHKSSFLGKVYATPCTGANGDVFLPVKKGDEISAQYSGVNVTYFRFIYAQGEI